MGSAKKFAWLVFSLMVIFLEQQSLGKSQSVPSGFKAKIYHLGYCSQLSPAHDHFQAMINHSINRMHYFGNALIDEPISFIFSGDMDYIIELSIGTPPKTFNLSIDTGSHITWVQDKDCVTCINKNGPSFDYRESSSAEEILCHQNECDMEDGIIECHDYSNKCSYLIEYQDGSNSSGIMLLEKFTFISIDKVKIILENVRLGAAFDCTEGAFHHTIQGVFGLSRNRRSFISQSGFNKFSYCIPSYRGMVEGSPIVRSNMMFGTEASPVGNSTAMAPHPDLYVRSLNGISVKGKRLELDQSIFRQPNGQGCTVVDTGSPISTMPEEAYEELVKTLGSMIKLPRVPYGNTDTLCFSGGLKDIDQHVPDMTLHFEGLDLTIIPRSLFFVLPNEVSCLAMQPMGYRDEYYIFGALLQQNINIVFDVGEEKIFMSPMTCASVI